jgi:hypothetical protein
MRSNLARKLPWPVSPERAVAIIQRWAQRSQNSAKYRSVAPLLRPIPSDLPLIDRVRLFVLPWSVGEYPGRLACLKVIAGVGSSPTLSRWRRNGIPPEACERLARFLESRVERELAMIAELRADAAARAARLKPPGLVTATAEDRSIWWDVRRQKAAEKRARLAKKAAGDPL